MTQQRELVEDERESCPLWIFSVRAYDCRKIIIYLWFAGSAGLTTAFDEPLLPVAYSTSLRFDPCVNKQADI